MKNHYVDEVPLNPEFELARFYCIKLFIFLFTLTLLLQIMSIEDVERIMDETKEGIEYQKVFIIILMQENILCSEQTLKLNLSRTCVKIIKF